jgi:hypothetical protein
LDSLLLEKFQQVSMFYFHTCIQNTSSIFTLLHPLHLPSHWYPSLDSACFIFLPFVYLNVYQLLQVCFTLVFQTFVCRTLITLSPQLVTIYFPFLYCLAPHYSTTYSDVHVWAQPW